MPQYKSYLLARPQRVSPESEATPRQGYKYVNENPIDSPIYYAAITLQ